MFRAMSHVMKKTTTITKTTTKGGPLRACA